MVMIAAAPLVDSETGWPCIDLRLSEIPEFVNVLLLHAAAVA
jgi:hypothetical protein